MMYDMLEKTLVADTDVRAAGEEGLERLQTRAGFVPALFTVAGTAAVRLDVRLAAALYCKNFVSLYWTRDRHRQGVHAIDIDHQNRLVEYPDDEDDDDGDGAEECDEDLNEASSGGDMAEDGAAGRRIMSEGSTRPKISAADRKAAREMIVSGHYRV